MRRLILTWLLGVVAAATGGCSVQLNDEDSPAGDEAFTVHGNYLGNDGSVRVERYRRSAGACSKREVGVSCSETVKLPVTIISVTCLPAAACKDIRLTGSEATFRPLEEAYSVQVIADIDGQRETVVKPTRSPLPNPRLRFGPSAVTASGDASRYPIAFVGSRFNVCKGPIPGTDPSVIEVIDADGTSLVGEKSSQPTCVGFVPRTAGELTLRTRVTDPDRIIEEHTYAIHATDEITDARPLSRGDALEVEDFGVFQILQCSLEGHTKAGVGLLPGRLVTLDTDVPYTRASEPADATLQFQFAKAPTTVTLRVDLKGGPVLIPVKP